MVWFALDFMLRGALPLSASPRPWRSDCVAPRGIRSVAISLLCLAAVACNGGPDEDGPKPGIFFGDLHVHSTNSVDVYALKLPLFGHHGRVSPMDHCRYARYCSQLDFWAITDHQEGAPPEAWDESVEATLLCNAEFGGHTDDPELVTFAGFEWQQSNGVAEANWGHKNVIFPGILADELPARAIASADQVTAVDPDLFDVAVEVASAMDPDHTHIYRDMGDYAVAGATATACDPNKNVRDLPTDCIESAQKPADLYRKLDQWGLPALVIPHGTTWGAHHPPLMSWEHQLTPEHHHPHYQNLLEIYSGHGSMEEYRTWRPAFDDQGVMRCTEPTADYEPCCWRAGEITRVHDPVCQADPASAECDLIVEDARQAFLDAGRAGIQSIPEALPSDWLDCDQCRDCFQPAEGHRPLGSAQAALAMSHFDASGNPDLRYQFGFLGSTDTHAVGPGAGYKEGREMSDIMGTARTDWEPVVDLMVTELFPNWVRQNSFFHSGGLVAVHAKGPDRASIWEALETRSVYATTGERMELWFDLVGTDVSMGGVATHTAEPTFRVEAKGSPIQKPGCPDWIPDDHAQGSCGGECYNPTDRRNGMDRIEVVRIRPQISPDEDLDDLIDDPFAVLDCGGAETCTVEFSDPDYVSGGRDALYYVRAVQLPTGQLNHEDLRCTFDEDGNCIEVDLCMGGAAGEGDDCIQDGGERAWASPIYLSPE